MPSSPRTTTCRRAGAISSSTPLRCRVACIPRRRNARSAMRADAAEEEARDRDADLARGAGLGARDGPLDRGVSARAGTLGVTPSPRPRGAAAARAAASAREAAAAAEAAARRRTAPASAAPRWSRIVVSSNRASVGCVTRNPRTRIPISPRTISCPSPPRAERSALGAALRGAPLAAQRRQHAPHACARRAVPIPSAEPGDHLIADDPRRQRIGEAILEAVADLDPDLAIGSQEEHHHAVIEAFAADPPGCKRAHRPRLEGLDPRRLADPQKHLVTGVALVLREALFELILGGRRQKPRAVRDETGGRRRSGRPARWPRGPPAPAPSRRPSSPRGRARANRRRARGREPAPHDRRHVRLLRTSPWARRPRRLGP